MGYTVAIVGATGAVGTRMIQQLEQSTLPVDKVRLLSSSRSAGKVLQYKDQDVTVELTTKDSFEGVDIALFQLAVLFRQNLPLCSQSWCSRC